MIRSDGGHHRCSPQAWVAGGACRFGIGANVQPPGAGYRNSFANGKYYAKLKVLLERTEMAYDEGLAQRLRDALDERRGVSEKKMFGGLCFLIDGKMCVGIVKDELMVRVGAERHAEALKQRHARPMDFTGRPMKGFVYVAPEGLDSELQLEWWVELGVACARSVTTAAVGKPKRPIKKKKRVSR